MREKTYTSNEEVIIYVNRRILTTHSNYYAKNRGHVLCISWGWQVDWNVTLNVLTKGN